MYHKIARDFFKSGNCKESHNLFVPSLRADSFMYESGQLK